MLSLQFYLLNLLHLRLVIDKLDFRELTLRHRRNDEEECDYE